MAKETSRAWFIIPAVILLLVGMTILSLRTGKKLTEQFAGATSAEVLIRAPSGGGVEAAKQLATRLALLGVNSSVVSADDRSIRLQLKFVSDPGHVAASVVEPQPVRVQPILDARPLLPTDAPELKLPVAPGAEKLPLPFVTASTRAEVEDVVAQRGLPSGMAYALECIPAPRGAEAGMCAAWLLGPETLEGSHVLDAKISSDVRTEEPLVTFTLDEEGARALEELTTKNLGRQAAIIALGEVRARPLMVEPSRGTAWTFSTRTGDTGRRQAVERAERIAAAAKLAVLPPLSVEKVETQK
ncbi:MAG: hypothetical protein WBV82_31340 [Myxococcaceae bacterium]